ncbi:MlaD family protein [soil metagenome]
MANKKFAEAKVGIFVLVAALIVIVTLFWAKGFSFTDKKRTMSAYFQSISALNPGDPMNVSGVKKGEIDKIELVGDSVRVDFTIDDKVKIKTDYKIEVAILALMGGNQLLLTPGKSASEVDYSKPLIGTPGGDIAGMMDKVNDLTEDVKDLIAESKKSAQMLSKTMESVYGIVGDANTKRDIRDIMMNMNHATSNLNGLIVENRGSLNNLTRRAGNTIVTVDSLLGRNSKELKNTFVNVENITTKIDSLVANLNIIVSDTKDQKNGLGKFVYDNKFYNNLNASLSELKKLMEKIRKDGVKIDLF